MGETGLTIFFVKFIFMTSFRGSKYLQCMYFVVTEKNWQICEAHLRYPFNFITEFQGCTDTAMKIDVHIFSAYMQYGHKCIHFSRVT